jgi:hypothetical protein
MNGWWIAVWAAIVVGYLVAIVVNDRAVRRLREAEQRRERQIGIMLGLQAGQALQSMEVSGESVYDADREGGAR